MADPQTINPIALAAAEARRKRLSHSPGRSVLSEEQNSNAPSQQEQKASAVANKGDRQSPDEPGRQPAGPDGISGNSGDMAGQGQKGSGAAQDGNGSPDLVHHKRPKVASRRSASKAPRFSVSTEKAPTAVAQTLRFEDEKSESPEDVQDVKQEGNGNGAQQQGEKPPENNEAGPGDNIGNTSDAGKVEQEGKNDKAEENNTAEERALGAVTEADSSVSTTEVSTPAAHQVDPIALAAAEARQKMFRRQSEAAVSSVPPTTRKNTTEASSTAEKENKKEKEKEKEKEKDVPTATRVKTNLSRQASEKVQQADSIIEANSFSRPGSDKLPDASPDRPERATSIHLHAKSDLNIKMAVGPHPQGVPHSSSNTSLQGKIEEKVEEESTMSESAVVRVTSKRDVSKGVSHSDSNSNLNNQTKAAVAAGTVGVAALNTAEAEKRSF
eukprot:g81937.t1